MTIEILPDAVAAAECAARYIADAARAALAVRGRFVLGVSGGSTPAPMLRALARTDLDWSQIDIVQVDERVAPAGDADRNLTALTACLRGDALERVRLHAMPVERPDLAAAAQEYATLLAARAGTPPVLDLVHLGLGDDGHTASLVPNDPVLTVADRDVAITGVYRGRVRMTLTYPLLNRARRILWLVTGTEKAAALARLRQSDPTIPAGRVRAAAALVFADRAAAAR